MKITDWSKADFAQNQVKINVLVESENSKEIQILLAKNSVMDRHKAPFAIHVQVLKGKIIFKVDEEYTLNTLSMISLAPNVEHSLQALEDSIVRLSLAKNDSAKRVNAVLKKP
ncbi:cupin domain-containing protein [Helicobacter burdigaliensis]|uniref:cupin domain-containing protein n=1 Tax=Helicobacter burdigaliensis TaxID=2315334 RepID=UPI000EF7052F|nr:cupin domain-containing protein [Helicobacter burdigaliensis]